MSVHVTTYEEFKMDDPATWKSPRPEFDVRSFNEQLERRAGQIGGLARFRLRWAGEEDKYILESGLVHTGYMYIKDGVETFVAKADYNFEFPDDAIPAPFFEHTNIFTPRWVIEEWDRDLCEYEKSWFVQTITKETQKEQGGRIDVVSRYREPAEIDLQMAEHLARLRLTLNTDDIQNGLAELAKMKARAEKMKDDEFVDEIAHETARALTDGIPVKPVTFDVGKSFDIREYNRKKLEELSPKI